MQLVQYLSASFHVVFMQQFGQYFEQRTHVVWQTGLGRSMGGVGVCHYINKKARSAVPFWQFAAAKICDGAWQQNQLQGSGVFTWTEGVLTVAGYMLF